MAIVNNLLMMLIYALIIASILKGLVASVCGEVPMYLVCKEDINPADFQLQVVCMIDMVVHGHTITVLYRKTRNTKETFS